MACLVNASEVGNVLRCSIEESGANSYPPPPGEYPPEDATAPVRTEVTPSNRKAPIHNPDSKRCSTPESSGYSNEGGPVGLFRILARPTNPTFVTVTPMLPTPTTACSKAVCAVTSVAKTAQNKVSSIVDLEFKSELVPESILLRWGRNGILTSFPIVRMGPKRRLDLFRSKAELRLPFENL